MNLVPLKLILTSIFMGGSVLPKSEIKQVSEVFLSGKKRLWEQRSCGEIAPMRRCECCLLALISRLLCTRRSFMWGNLYEIWLWNTWLRKDLTCAVTKPEFSGLFHIEHNNEGCVIITKSTKKVFKLKISMFQFCWVPNQSKNKTWHNSWEQNSCKTPWSFMQKLLAFCQKKNHNSLS